jgi:hypothetical protein
MLYERYCFVDTSPPTMYDGRDGQGLISQNEETGK